MLVRAYLTGRNLGIIPQMDRDAPLPRYPRLRLGINAIRTGDDSILFVSGSRPIKIKGPQVASVILPVIQAMDGLSSLSELAYRLPDITPKAILDAVKELSQIGVLWEATAALTGARLDSQHFMERFAGIVDKRSQTSLRNGTFHQAEFRIQCSASWAEPLQRHLLLLGAIATMSTERCERADMRPFASVIVEQPSTCIDMCSSTHQDNLVYVIAVPLPEARRKEAIEIVAPLPEESIASIIAHWILAAHLGMPVVPEIAPRTGARNRPKPGEAGRLKPTAPALIGDVPGGLVECLERICALSVGWIDVDGTSRHVAPTAGDVASVHAIWLVLGGDTSGARALYFEASASSLVSCADVKRFESQVSSEGIAHGAVLLLLASPSMLRNRYGEAGVRLACYDTGFAFDHAERAARALGMTPRRLEQSSSSDLLKKFHLPITDDWEAPCTPLAVTLTDSSKGRQHLSTTASLVNQLRPMIERRSVRRFSPVTPPMDLVLSLEQTLMQAAYDNSWWREAGTAVSMIRIMAQGANSIQVCRVPLNGTKGEAVALEVSRSRMNWIIPQSELVQAPLIYLVDGRSPDPLADCVVHDKVRWGKEGALCSALWIEAQGLGLVGTPFGSADATALDLFDAPFKGLALCLGYP